MRKTRRNKVQKFWDQQADWSQNTFGLDSERGPIGPLKHLEKEAKEAYEEAHGLSLGIGEDMDGNLYSQERLEIEISDCLFLTFDAARRAGMTLDTLLETAFKKLEINKQRKWQKPTDNNPVEHVRE